MPEFCLPSTKPSFFLIKSSEVYELVWICHLAPSISKMHFWIHKLVEEKATVVQLGKRQISVVDKIYREIYIKVYDLSYIYYENISYDESNDMYFIP
jgi:hypothetical protein